ncbi:phosphatase PAP2 family protein [Amycolatopsis sp. NBC_01480]|uniref:phosphatase PAP2 family protein n=1 Tax=Amycolatopsis sp. NBC_01480 TaxID=2903562 RepID=UPI002E2A89BA|nr:phosphatase PAP2 family protein [Amycolatopsis sp. NBC_01480]
MVVMFSETPSATSSTAPRHALVTAAASRTVLLITAAAGCAVAFVVAYLLFVRTASGQQTENGVVHSAQSSRRSTVDWAAPLQHADLVVALGGVAVLVLAIALARRRFALGVTALVLLGTPMLAAQLLKIYVLDRPSMNDGLAVASHNSFPSGHVSAATAVVLALGVVLPARFRTWVLAGGSLGVAWVAAATVALGWHRLSDTVGGSLLVAAVVCAGAAVVSARRPDPGGVPLVPVLVALLAPSALVLGGYAVLATATSGAAQFVAAMVLAAACSAAVILLVAGPLRRVNFDPARAGSRLSR